MFSRVSYTAGTDDVQRQRYHLALIGPAACAHQSLLERAGYPCVATRDGAKASQLFDRTAVDVVVIDFELSGKPPEAVLLFGRRSCANAPVIALVPAEKSDAYRRAFLAGARDVLPTPTRGEDLLASVDLALENRALSDALDEVRQGMVDPHALTSSSQIEELTGELERMRRKGNAADNFRQQALEAMTERDRAVQAKRAARKKLTQLREDFRARTAQLSMAEKACGELQQQLKAARDQGRQNEVRAATLKKEMERQKAQTRQTDELIGEASDREMSVPLDPEEALKQRAVDERRLAQLEKAFLLQKKSEAKVAALEETLAARSRLDSLRSQHLASQTESAMQADLDAARQEHGRLLRRVNLLESQLQEGPPAPSAEKLAAQQQALQKELDQEREALAEALGVLDAVRMERAGLKKRVQLAEREVADALTAVDELEPLKEEMAKLRGQLHAEHMAQLKLHHDFDVAQQQQQQQPPSQPIAEEIVALQHQLEQTHERERELLLKNEDIRLAAEVQRRELVQTQERLHRAEAELDSTRVTLAAIAGDRLAQKGTPQPT